MEVGTLSRIMLVRAPFSQTEAESRTPMILAHACTDQKKETAQIHKQNKKEELDAAHDGGKKNLLTGRRSQGGGRMLPKSMCCITGSLSITCPHIGSLRADTLVA